MLLKHTTRTVRAVVKEISDRIVIDTLERHGAVEGLGVNLSCTEICGVSDARVTVLAKEIHQNHASTP